MLSFHTLIAQDSGCNPGSETGFNLAQCVKLGKSATTIDQVYTSPAVLINTIVQNLFIIGGLIFFFMFIYAGIKMIQGDKEVDEAKTILTVALKGFVLMFVAFFRELFGSGTVFGYEVLRTIRQEGGWYDPDNLMLLPPSAFFLIGFLIWVIRVFYPEQIEEA